MSVYLFVRRFICCCFSVCYAEGLEAFNTEIKSMRLANRFFLCGILILTLISGCANNLHTGNGKWVTQSRSVPKFDRLNVDGHFKLVYEDHHPRALQVSADENLLPYIRTVVTNGELMISIKPGVRLRTSRVITLHVGSESLEQLTAQGTSDIQLKDLREDWLRVNARGGDVISLQGEVKEAVYDCQDVVKIDASKLATVDTMVKMSGASQVVAHVDERLDVNLSGMAKVSYMGQPKLSTHILDSAEVVSVSA
jgi:hypothetical protein